MAVGGAFQGSLTGLDNLRFIGRVYGVDFRPRVDYAEEFSEPGRYLREPVKTYSSGMRARLAFAISMAIEYECYLIDEIIAVGDSRFHEKCQHELFEKRRDRAMIMVSHNPEFLHAHCDHAADLVRGRLTNFDRREDAFAYYHEAMLE